MKQNLNKQAFERLALLIELKRVQKENQELQQRVYELTDDKMRLLEQNIVLQERAVGTAPKEKYNTIMVSLKGGLLQKAN